MIAQLHRLIRGIALALCVVCLSIQRPASTYDDAEKEIDSLQGGIEAVTGQRHIPKDLRQIGAEVRHARLAA